MPDSRPGAQIRRFDIFAEWNRLRGARHHHLPEPQARAYGFAVARIVAARKFAGYQPQQVREWRRQAKQEDSAPEHHEDAWWKHLGSPEEFERKIVQRMGPTFYREVFQPAILRAWEAGRSYEEIRDSLREEWNRPEAPAAKAA